VQLSTVLTVQNFEKNVNEEHSRKDEKDACGEGAPYMDEITP
jgi:hypothetical protein